MTLLKPALIAAAVAVASPAFANGFNALPSMPTLTFPQEGAFETATRNSGKVIETCDFQTDEKTVCAQAVEDRSVTIKTSRGQ